jgi:hypothetical protein
MKKQILILCALCAVCIPARSAEEKPAPAQPVPAAASPANDQLSAANAQLTELRSAIDFTIGQRDENAKLAQNTQLSLALAQKKIQSLTQELQIAKAKVAAQKPEAGSQKPEEKIAAATVAPKPVEGGKK